MINKKGKTHVTPSSKITSSAVATNKQADTLLRQVKTENAIKDLAKSNKRMGIISNQQPTTATKTTTQATATKSKKK